jgi:hypothetical protein
MSFATVQSLIAITKIPDVEVAVREGCSSVTLARNWVAGEFLFKSYDRIFWIDSDMRFERTMFERMLKHSDDVPIIGAAYPSRMNPEKPNVLLLDGRPKADDKNRKKVAALGFGFMIIWREVMEKMANGSAQMCNDTQRPYAEIFQNGRRQRADGYWAPVTEDYMFCFKVREQYGYDVRMACDVRPGHLAEHAFRMSDG